MAGPVQDNLGLADPQAEGGDQQQGTDQQKIEFKAAVTPKFDEINGYLQFLAAHAPQEQHSSESGKRETAYSAFQAAVAKIDPTNPSVAQGAIDKVIGAVGGLTTAIKTVKETVERALEAWKAREGELSDWGDKVREMVDWGFEKAAKLQQIVDAIAGKANARQWNEALQALDSFISKVGPLFEEYLRQAAAKVEYDQALPDLENQLAEVATCEFASLEEESVQLTSAADQMRQAATSKDYVSALEQLRALETRVADHLARRDDLRAKKDDYEQARAELDPRLAEVSTSQYQSLAELDQQIVDLTGRTDEAAAAEDYEQAVQLVAELSSKVDEKLQRIEEIEAAKAEYEQSRAELEPKLSEASTSEHAALAELDQQIADLTGRVDEAAAAEEYEQARDLLGELSTKVDEKLQRVAEIEAAREEYESALAALQPRLTEASECLYPSLESLTQEIATVQGEMEGAAAEKDWERARELCHDLASKVDAYLQAKQDLERQYQEKLGAAQSAVEQLKTHGQSEHFSAEIGNAETQLGQAKSQGDGNMLQAALDILKQVISLCSETLTTMQLVDQGLDRARAEEVADVSQELIDTGVDRAKALEVGHVMKTGGSGTVEDSKIVAKQVAELPMDVVQGLRAKGTDVVACRDSITDHIPDLKGKKPRGWKKGTWDSVPGLFDPNENEVVIATRGHKTAEGAHVPKTGDGHGAYDLVTHEAMHGYDHNGGGTPHHSDPDFVAARKADYDKLGDDYYTQSGAAGMEETYAESAARYYDGDPTLKTEWPHLYEYWDKRGASKGSGSGGARGSGPADGGAGGAGGGTDAGPPPTHDHDHDHDHDHLHAPPQAR